MNNAVIETTATGLAGQVGFSRKMQLKARQVFHRRNLDQRGGAAVEFALVANVFIMLVFLMIEASWMMTVDMAVNDAAQAASRLGSLGTLPPKGSREDAIKAAMVDYGVGLLNNDYLTVTMQSYGTAYNYGHHDPNAKPISGAGSGRQLVQYLVSYSQPLLTPFSSALLGGQASFTHSTSIMVQNEPF